MVQLCNNCAKGNNTAPTTRRLHAVAWHPYAIDQVGRYVGIVLLVQWYCTRTHFNKLEMIRIILILIYDNHGQIGHDNNNIHVNI